MSLLRRLAFGLALAGAAGSVCLVPSLAAAEPAAAKLEDAAKSFESGAKAFKEKRFEEAALQFELADAAVPSAKALRLAIRSRKEAGQASRAATLAGLALERYPDDPDTKKLASDVIGELGPKLHRLDVACASPCILALGSRVAHGPSSTRWSVFADPGTVLVSASFFGTSGGEQKVEATEGGSSSIRFEPQGGAPAPGPTEPAPGPAEPGPAEPGPAEPTPAGENGVSLDTASGSGLSPAVFFVGAGITAVLAGVTVWSGVDTQSNPGPDAVRAACAGQGTECPAYQDGQAAEMRTNVLIGATAGVGVVTLAIGIFFTDWGGGDAPAEASAQSGAPSLWIGAGGARVPLAGRAYPDAPVVAPPVVGELGDLALRVGGSF